MVVCVIGDGAFNYNPVPACLGLAQQYGVPILVIICNNQGYVSQEWNLYKYFPSGYALRDNNPYGRVIEPTPDYAGDCAGLRRARRMRERTRANWNRRSAAQWPRWNRDTSHCLTCGSSREAEMADVVLRPGPDHSGGLARDLSRRCRNA